ncbi:MAG: DUF4843 domain-containing protein [Odoribacter sp.]
MKRLLLILTAVFLLVSCQQEEVTPFTSDDAGIYFQRQASYTMGTTNVNYTDSAVYSFASSSSKVTKTTTSVPVFIMGNVKNYNRTFKVKIDEEKTTAVRGVHFDVNLDTLYIPAGKNTFNIPLTLYRHPDLLKNSYRIELLLVENEEFKLLIPNYKNNNQWNNTGFLLSGIRWKIIFSEKYTTPSYWRNFGDDFYGQWTTPKYLLLNNLMNWTVVDWNNAGMSGAKISYGRMGFSARVLQKELQQRADAGKPEYDEDGKYMQLPSPYNVDYSKYE